MTFINDLEYDLKSYCLKQKGRWWANHLFCNKGVNDLYNKLRRIDAGTVIAIVGNGGPNYQEHIDGAKHIQRIITNKSSKPEKPGC